MYAGLRVADGQEHLVRDRAYRLARAAAISAWVATRACADVVGSASLR